MKKKEMREVEIYYCDVCSNECGLPYYSQDDVGYGKCCYSKMYKAEIYLKAVNKLRKGIGMKQLDMSYLNMRDVVNKEYENAHGRELEPSGTDAIS